MAQKKRRTTESVVVDTKARRRIKKELGAKGLQEVEGILIMGDIDAGGLVETNARKRLMKEIGKKELERIEAAILSGEL